MSFESHFKGMYSVSLYLYVRCIKGSSGDGQNQGLHTSSLTLGEVQQQTTLLQVLNVLKSLGKLGSSGNWLFLNTQA